MTQRPLAITRRSGQSVDYTWSLVFALRRAVLYGPGHGIKANPPMTAPCRAWVKKNPRK